MAFTAEMTKLDSLNSFFYERLMSVAGEIFQAVKDAFTEYQEEIHRSNQENVYLRKMLAEVSRNNSAAGSQPSQADCLSKDTTDALLDSDTSLVQVKLELCTKQQDAQPQQPVKDPSSCLSPGTYSQEPLLSFSSKTLNVEGKNDDCSLTDSTSRLESWNSQTISSDDSNSTLIQSENGHENKVAFVKDEPYSHEYSQCEEPCIEFTPLSPHLQNHTSDKLLYCEVCGKQFKYDRVLKAHMVVHQKERPYRCELCGKCYSYAHVLKIHLRIHTGERPYHCRYCGKAFNQKGHVKGHERIHTGEKIYSCSVCGKHFTWLGQGKEHLRIHHDQDHATIVRKIKTNC